MTTLLTGLNRRNLGRELLAGVTLLAIAVPLNIGYAQIAGLPAAAGLAALVVPTLVWALATSSRQLVASPDAAAAALVASSIGGLAVAGSEHYAIMALAQAVICGVLFAVMAVCKLGFLANFLSKPILIGFVAGLALDILVSQVAKMLGVRLESGLDFGAKALGLLAGLGGTNPWSALIAAGGVGILLLGKRVAPVVPWALVVMVLATVVALLTNAAAAGVAVLGAVPGGFPALTWPTLGWQDWLALVPSALALTMVTAAEGLLVSRSYGEQRGYVTRPNRDLLAFGMANVAAGASGSFVLGASTSRTAAMDQAGSRTQLPSLVLAAGTLLLLLFGTGLLAEIPSPAIGAIVGVAVLPLLGVSGFRGLWRVSRAEFWIGLVCFAVTLCIGALAGILVAFVLALINLARRAAHPAIDVLGESGDPSTSALEGAPPATRSEHGPLVIRMAAPLFFANGAVFVQAVREAVAEAGGAKTVRHLVIDLEGVTDVDVTGAEAFAGLRAWLREADISLSFSRLRRAARPRLNRFGVVRTGDPVYATNRAAMTALAPTPERNES